MGVRRDTIFFLGGGGAGPRPLRYGVSDSSIGTCPSPTQVLPPWSFYVISNYGDHPKKFDPLRSPPFKIMQGHWNRHESNGYL